MHSGTARQIIGRIIGTLAILCLAFVGGVVFHDVRSVHDVGSLRTVLSLLPGRVTSAMVTAAHGDANEYTPYETYADVLKTLQDNYYGLKEYGGHYGGVGIVTETNKQGQVAIAKLLPGTSAAQSSLQAGDEIVKVDDQPTTQKGEIEVNDLLWGDPGTTAHVTISRHGATSTVSLPRAVIPKSIDTTQITYNAIRGMMASLKDRYTRFLDPTAYKAMMDDNQGQFVGIGAVLGTNKANQIYIVRVLPKGPARKAKVMAGDIILKVDGRSTLKKPDTEVVKLIRGQPNTTVVLTMLRGTQTKVIAIPRGVVQQEVVQHAMIDPVRKIGYISLAQFNEESDIQMNAALHDLQLKGMRALILDLRGNPGGLLDIAQQVASRFVPSGPIVWIKSKTETMATMEHLDVLHSEHAHRYQYPLVVLVDGNSASAAEIVSGAIKDTDSGTLVGEKTFGKGLVQTIMPLPDNSAVAITTQHYYTAHKNDINHKGIVPNVVVKWSDDATRKHFAFLRNNPDAIYDIKYDPQLKKGLSILDQNLQVANAGPKAWPQ